MSESLALNALNRVETLATLLGSAEATLERGYAGFAEALLDVQKNCYWEGEHESWGDYMRFITDKFKMGRAQLYHKVAVVRELQGVVESQDLSDMGISKASVLADIHRATGTIPESAIVAAKNSTVTVKDLKQSLADALRLPDDEPGEWYDLNFAFYVTAEEKATLQDAVKAAMMGDPPISNTLKDFQQRKQVALKWAMEFLGSNPTEPRPDEITDADIPF